MDSIRTTWLATKAACPVCRKVLDGATGDGTPEPNSLTVCVYCGVFLSFTASMGLRVLSEQEWRDLPVDTRDQLTLYLNITKRFRDSREL